MYSMCRLRYAKPVHSIAHLQPDGEKCKCMRCDAMRFPQKTKSISETCSQQGNQRNYSQSSQSKLSCAAGARRRRDERYVAAAARKQCVKQNYAHTQRRIEQSARELRCDTYKKQDVCACVLRQWIRCVPRPQNATTLETCII